MGKFWDWLMDDGEYESAMDIFDTEESSGLRCVTRSYDRKKDNVFESSLEIIKDRKGEFLRLRTRNIGFELMLKNAPKRKN